MSGSPRVLIVGGGIAGPVTAIALHRVGIDAVVYEAHPTPATNAGAFLTIAVNGLDALRTLDLDRPVMAAGFATATIEFLSGTGKRLGEVPIGGRLADGTMTHTIKRADLYRILHQETVRRGIPVAYNKRLASAEPAPDGVLARFEDGSTARANVLVGADGIHSRVRRLIDPRAPEPRYTGLGNVGGFTRTPGVPHTDGAYLMVFGKRAFFGYAVSPSGEIWWFANPGSRRPFSRDELAAMTPEGWKAWLLYEFADDAGPARDIVRSTNGTILGTNQHDLPRVPVWHRGSMVIIGDAAHAANPASGQGASMAIEDGLVLAQCLRDRQPDQAFADYERIRRPRVERVVAFGARSSSGKAPGPLGRVARDLMLPLVLRIVARRSRDWLFGHHIDFALTSPFPSASTSPSRREVECLAERLH